MPWALKQWGAEVDDFLKEVSAKGPHARLLTWLEKLSEEGPHLRRHTRALKDGLFELKLELEGNAHRCLYGFHDNNVAIVVCFIKKKQRDQEQIAIARKRLAAVKANRAEVGDVALH